MLFRREFRLPILHFEDRGDGRVEIRPLKSPPGSPSSSKH